jgi:hypothetical protein
MLKESERASGPGGRGAILFLQFRFIESNPIQAKRIGDETQGDGQEHGSDAEGKKESGLRGKTVPKLHPKKAFLHARTENGSEKAGIEAEADHLHPDRGSDRIVRDDPPRQVRPRADKDGHTVQPEQKGDRHATDGVQSQERRKPQEDADGVSEGRVLRCVIQMEKLFDQISETSQ